MCHHTGLVVGDAPTVKATGTLDRLERVALPLAQVTGRLDVVVCVQQYGRCTRRRWAVTDHGWVTVADGYDPDVRKPRAVQQFGRRLCGPGEVAVVEPIEGDAGDAYQAFEIGSYSGA
jgi:hypothetical protein